MKELRDYQEKALSALFDYFQTKNGNPIIAAPVGAGKSLMIAEFIKRSCELYPGTRFMVLSHVTELLTQTAQELLGQNPNSNISFYAAKLGKKNLTGDVIFASIQSVFGRAYDLTKPIDLVICDECHLIGPKQETMYQRLLKDLKVLNLNLKVIGFTGTAFRATEGTLIDGDDRIFTDIAYQIPMLYLIKKGYLVPPVTPEMKTKMSITNVGIRNGDYIESQLQKAIDKEDVTKACVKEIIEHGQERKKWIVFTAGIEHCEHVRDEIRSHGISCEMVHGKTPTAERNEITNRYTNGDLRCLVNVAVFTTGFNNPAIDLLAFMRPTRSPVLYVQCCGRAIRTYPGKKDALILDFGGVISALGPLDLIDAKRTKGSGNGDAPVKVCPECHAVCFAGVHYCPDCDFKFEINDPFQNLIKQATTAPIISTQIKPQWHDVREIYYKRHEKIGKPPSMRVDYYTFSGIFSEWICYEHSGYARDKAIGWHRKRSTMPIPKNVDEALKITYPAPSKIQITKDGKYDRIVAYDFSKRTIKKEELAVAEQKKDHEEEYYEIPF